jgi:hypothetical protein
LLNIENKAKIEIKQKMGINQLESTDESHQDDLQKILKLVKKNSAALEKLTEEVNILKKTKLVKAQVSLETLI